MVECGGCGTFSQVPHLRREERLTGILVRSGLFNTRRITVVLASIALAGACTTGDISADVVARNVLGSYTATVSNDSDQQLLVSCTVTASTGDTDRFSVTLDGGETVTEERKMPLSDFTADLSIECA